MGPKMADLGPHGDPQYFFSEKKSTSLNPMTHDHTLVIEFLDLLHLCNSSPLSQSIFKTFLDPRGPLRTPLVSVPLSATKIHATSHYYFSDSKLILFLFQTLSPHNLSHSTQYHCC